MSKLLKVEPLFVFPCSLPSPLSSTRYDHMSICQEDNQIYFGFPVHNIISVFDLDGNFLFSIKIRISLFILGKLCSLSANKLCVSNRYRPLLFSIYIITCEGVVITKYNMANVNPRSFVDCKYSVKTNILCFAKLHVIYSLGDEGMIELKKTDFRISNRPSASITFIHTNLLLVYYKFGKISVFDVEHDVLLRELNLDIRPRYNMRCFDYSDNLFFYYSMPSEIVLKVVYSPNQNSASLLDGRSIRLSVPAAKFKLMAVHSKSRRLYIEERDNRVRVYDLDEIIRLSSTKPDEKETDSEQDADSIPLLPLIMYYI